MTESKTRPNKRVSREKKSNNAITVEKQGEQKQPTQQNHDNQASRETAPMKREKDAPTTSTAEEHELVPVRHPRLPNMPPRYFVNKNGVICSNAKGKFIQMKIITKGSHTGSYRLRIDVKKARYIKLEEIMAYTFSEHFDSDKNYIIHRDRRLENCTWDNLIICNDLPALQQEEIAILKRLHPDTEYTVVRNIHDTLTFERYLVSDAGEIYSLITRKHLRLFKNRLGYLQVILTCDIDEKQTTTRRAFLVHRIVIQSFAGRLPKGSPVSRISGKRSDIFLENLEDTYQTKRKRPMIWESTTEEQRSASKKITLIPFPPLTDEARWKTISVLPWNKMSFSQYEVSDTGHIRNKNTFRLLNLWCSGNKYAKVHMRHDEQDRNTWPHGLEVARLVANAFVDGYSETRNVVMHLNGNRIDNRAQNLKWVSKQSTSIQRRARPVVASLVDDPVAQKHFPSMHKAGRELSIHSLSYFVSKYGSSFTREVTWDGEKKLALIQVLLSKKDE